MIHTLPVSGTGQTRESALLSAVQRANQLFCSIAFLSEKHIVSLTPTWLSDPGPGPQEVTLVYVLDIPAASAQTLDEKLADVSPQEALPVLQKPGVAWLYALGKWHPIQDPCSYPPNWTVDTYRQALEAQGYRYEHDFFDLGDARCPTADEVTVGFAIYVADDLEETLQRPPYPYRIEACVFLSDWEPPIYIADYPSLLDLLATFAPIVQTRLHIAHLVADQQEEEGAD